MNSRSTSMTVDTSCAVYISIFLLSTRRTAACVGLKITGGALATELCLWTKSNQKKQEKSSKQTNKQKKNRKSSVQWYFLWA